MQTDRKTPIQMISGTVIMQERTVNGSIDDTILDAIRELAQQLRTAFWVETASDGAVRRYGSEMDASLSLNPSRRVYEIVVRPEAMPSSFNCDDPAVELDRFWIVVSNIEAEYDAAIAAVEAGLVEIKPNEVLAGETL